MLTKVRQWPFQMTAGLLPVQLVHNYQLRQLFLLFSIKKDLYKGMIEPLMSQTVWKSGMGRVRQVALDKRVWSISGLASVQIGYNQEQGEIQVVVAFNEDVGTEQTAENNRTIAELFAKVEEFPFPELKYTFSDSEQESASFNKSKGG